MRKIVWKTGRRLTLGLLAVLAALSIGVASAQAHHEEPTQSHHEGPEQAHHEGPDQTYDWET